jgi:hypothetical protein
MNELVVKNSAHRRLANPVHIGNLLLGVAFPVTKSLDPLRLRVGQFAPSAASSLCVHVSNVVLNGAEKKVLWIHTRADIALVQDSKPLRVAHEKFVSNPMSHLSLAIKLKLSVAITVKTRFPKVTSRFHLLYLLHETLENIRFRSSHITPSLKGVSISQ